MSQKFKEVFNIKNTWKKYLFITLLMGGFLFAGYAMAQDYGVNAVSDGLGGALGEADRDPREIAGRLINFALGFLGVIAVLIIMYGGFKWMTSGGSEDKVAEAKKILVAGVIGLIIILSSWAIATFLISRFSEVINNGDNQYSYDDGDTMSCGCGGYMVYRNGSWGTCIGGDCGPGQEPDTCNSSPFGGMCYYPLDNMCGEGYFCDNDCYCQSQGSAGDACNLNASGVCAPDDNMCGPYLTCDADSCTCIGSPVITGISPVGGFCQNDHNISCKTDDDCGDSACNTNAPNGATGNFLSIYGKSFGEYVEGESKVVFVGTASEKEAVFPNSLNPSCVNFWSDEQIVVAVPSGAPSGAIKVVSGEFSDSTNDDYGPIIPDFRANSIVRPGLCEIDPNRGSLSDDVNYQGVNLYASNAFFGNYSSNVAGLASNFSDQTGLTGIAKTPNIRAGNSGSFVTANINGNYENSNYLAFVKEMEEGEGAFISSFSPSSGNVGQYVTIFGSGFGNTKGTNRVYISNIEVDYDFPEVCLNSVWRNDQVTVKVPAGLDDGEYTITMHIGDKVISSENINPNAFKFDKNISLKTSLCKIDPIRGPTGTEVSFWGEYFGNVNSQALVRFSGTNENVSAIIQKDGRADFLSASVPDNAITGPVRVIKYDEYGNELNFSVGECVSNADCGLQVCCPAQTYKKGQCVNSLDQCFVEVASSVYEWSFSTGYAEDIPDVDSCEGLASYYGACFVGGCPNVPGMCSPYSGGNKIFSSSCSQDCNLVAGCKIGENSCYFDQSLDRCIQNLETGLNRNCDMARVVEYQINEEAKTVNAICNQNNRWEIIVPSSCPEGFVRGLGNRCYDPNSECLRCENGLTCQDINGQGRCVSERICPTGFNCEEEGNSGQYKCASISTASCDCCCTIGQSARDCCSYEKDGQLIQLECMGSCGTDTGKNDAVLGRCGGCANAGDTAAERDAACNCTGSTAQYCEVNNEDYPNGYCTDCSGLGMEGCLEHSNSCCYDGKNNVCRGITDGLVSDDPDHEDFGYCAYYNCSNDANTCAVDYPVRTGQYSRIITCETSCEEEDPCSSIETFDACVAEESGRCCFDYKTDTCAIGAAISDGDSLDNGYCAYYNCSQEDPFICGINEPDKEGKYKTIKDCDQFCANELEGMGLSCFSNKDETCNISACNAPGFSCITSAGVFSQDSSQDCGACCCQPVTVTRQTDACKKVNEVLSCMPDKGNCSGDNRGLCCGCETDEQCGSKETIGCGYDTCCEARPKILNTSPEHLSTNVCRNAYIDIEFDQVMEYPSLPDNIVLLEEVDPSSGSCAPGQLLAQAESVDSLLRKNNIITRVIASVNNTIRKVFSSFSSSYAQRVFAEEPSSTKLYCIVPGTVYIENTLNSSMVSFAPESLLKASTNYYLLVKGDEGLDSQTGIRSIKGVGFNGEGYLNVSGEYVDGEKISFNTRSFKNSQIIKFSTLSSQGQMAGVCHVDEVKLNPSSYLFRTTDNALQSQEDDRHGSGTFDTVADRDKVFSLSVMSSDGQRLRPVTGYYWDYNFSIADLNVVEGSRLENMPSNQYFVSARSGITDAETRLRGTIDMTRFSDNESCDSQSSCVCTSASCPENCCNFSFGGDGFSSISTIYVFICNNPWPAIQPNGNWMPWFDSADNCLSNEECTNFNYKFYYCRDAGSAQTYDDLPAILNRPVTIGRTSNLVCSTDRTISCNSLNERCGVDANNDGQLDGVCMWDVLKDSYFFREDVPSSGEIISVNALSEGSAVEISWRSGVFQADTYKVYYLKSGSGEIKYRELSANDTDVCRELDGFYNCSTVISNLDNDVNYIFRIGVVSVNGAESRAVNEMSVMPKDIVAPGVPQDFSVEVRENDVGEELVIISWTDNTDDASKYRLYRGLNPGVYSDTLDINKGPNFKSEIEFIKSDFSSGNNYFAISALDASGNESSKSTEVLVNIVFDQD